MRTISCNKRELEGILNGSIQMLIRTTSEDIREDELVRLEEYGYYLHVYFTRAQRLHELATSDCQELGLEVNMDIYNVSMYEAHDEILSRYAKIWDEELEEDRDLYKWDNNPIVYTYSFNLLEQVFREGQN